jgi:hypothetical protein
VLSAGTSTDITPDIDNRTGSAAVRVRATAAAPGATKALSVRRDRPTMALMASTAAVASA